MMNRKQMGQIPYSSGMHRQPAPVLSVNTSSEQNPRTQQPLHQVPLSASLDVPTPRYPLPIPFEKQQKALDLYDQYQAAVLEEGLAQREHELVPAIDNYLTVPGPSAPLSTTSHMSSRHRKPASVSDYNPTEMSSVISFEDNPSAASTNSRKHEWKTYDGKMVKTRKRKKLVPTARAKAALIRHLGSCAACKARAVSCPLDHYDIASLEQVRRLQLQNSQYERRPKPKQQSRSSNSVSTKHRRSISGQQFAKLPQKEELFLGIGQGEQVNQQFLPPSPGGYMSMSQLENDLASPSRDILSSISNPAPLYQAAETFPIPSQSLYFPMQYKNGSMLPIGDFRNALFHCRYQGPQPCPHQSHDIESLQVHFEDAHFAFTRIDPAARFVCSECGHIDNQIDDPRCRQCRVGSDFQMWIYGHYIQHSSYGHQPTDDQDLHNYTPTSASQYAASYSLPNMDSHDSIDPSNYNGNLQTTNFEYYTGDSFGGSDTRSQYGHHPFQDQGPSNDYPQGYSYEMSQHAVEKGTVAIDHYDMERDSSCSSKLMTLGILLLLAITFGFIWGWVPSNLRLALVKVAAIRSYIPAVAFISIVGFFAMCSSLKHVGIARMRRASCQHLRLACFRGSAPYNMRCRQIAPDTITHGGAFL